jgi:hypothetical protein
MEERHFCSIEMNDISFNLAGTMTALSSLPFSFYRMSHLNSSTKTEHTLD